MMRVDRGFRLQWFQVSSRLTSLAVLIWWMLPLEMNEGKATPKSEEERTKQLKLPKERK